MDSEAESDDSTTPLREASSWDEEATLSLITLDLGSICPPSRSVSTQWSAIASTSAGPTSSREGCNTSRLMSGCGQQWASVGDRTGSRASSAETTEWTAMGADQYPLPVVAITNPDFISWNSNPLKIYLKRPHRKALLGFFYKMKKSKSGLEVYFLVKEVTEDPALAGGLQVGDWIRSINGQPLQEKQHAMHLTEAQKVMGVTLVIQRPESVQHRYRAKPLSVRSHKLSGQYTSSDGSTGPSSSGLGTRVIHVRPCPSQLGSDSTGGSGPVTSCCLGVSPQATPSRDPAARGDHLGTNQQGSTMACDCAVGYRAGGDRAGVRNQQGSMMGGAMAGADRAGRAMAGADRAGRAMAGAYRAGQDNTNQQDSTLRAGIDHLVSSGKQEDSRVEDRASRNQQGEERMGGYPLVQDRLGAGGDWQGDHRPSISRSLSDSNVDQLTKTPPAVLRGGSVKTKKPSSPTPSTRQEQDRNRDRPPASRRHHYPADSNLLDRALASLKDERSPTVPRINLVVVSDDANRWVFHTLIALLRMPPNDAVNDAQQHRRATYLVSRQGTVKLLSELEGQPQGFTLASYSVEELILAQRVAKECHGLVADKDIDKWQRTPDAPMSTFPLSLRLMAYFLRNPVEPDWHFVEVMAMHVSSQELPVSTPLFTKHCIVVMCVGPGSGDDQAESIMDQINVIQTYSGKGVLMPMVAKDVKDVRSRTDLDAMVKSIEPRLCKQVFGQVFFLDNDQEQCRAGQPTPSRSNRKFATVLWRVMGGQAFLEDSSYPMAALMLRRLIRHPVHAYLADMCTCSCLAGLLERPFGRCSIDQLQTQILPALHHSGHVVFEREVLANGSSSNHWLDAFILLEVSQLAWYSTCLRTQARRHGLITNDHCSGCSSFSILPSASVPAAAAPGQCSLESKAMLAYLHLYNLVTERCVRVRRPSRELQRLPCLMVREASRPDQATRCRARKLGSRGVQLMVQLAGDALLPRTGYIRVFRKLEAEYRGDRIILQTDIDAKFLGGEYDFWINWKPWSGHNLAVITASLAQDQQPHHLLLYLRKLFRVAGVSTAVIGPPCPRDDCDKGRCGRLVLHVIPVPDDMYCGCRPVGLDPSICRWTEPPSYLHSDSSGREERNGGIWATPLLDLDPRIFREIYLCLRLSWKELAGILGYTQRQVEQREAGGDPVKEILAEWDKRSPGGATLACLVGKLEEIGRADVITDIKRCLEQRTGLSVEDRQPVGGYTGTDFIPQGEPHTASSSHAFSYYHRAPSWPTYPKQSDYYDAAQTEVKRRFGSHASD